MDTFTEQGRVQTALVCAMVGAAAAVLIGRKKTQVDNFMIGGLFTGFAAYRDPRATVLSTMFVAAIEGTIWGVTDRLVPQLKDVLLPPPPESPPPTSVELPEVA